MTKTKVLCVEDDNINAFIMERLFADELDLLVVPDGDTAIDKLGEDSYEVILLDINLGKGRLDGIEVLKTIRQKEDYKETPIFAITSYAMPGDEARFLDSGFDGYFSKPIDKQKLLEEIQQVLND